MLKTTSAQPTCWVPPPCGMSLVQSAWQRFSQRGLSCFFVFFLVRICFSREQIAHWMGAMLDEATDPWGVKVERVEM